MKNKKIGIVGAAVTSVLVATMMGTPAAHAEAKVITMWTDLDRAGAFQQWARRFNAKHSNIVLNVIGKDGAKDKLTTVADADAPDIILGAHDWIGPLKASNLIVPVTIPLATQFEARDKAAFKLMGATYGLPVTVENIGLFRNANMVAKAPKTFKELETTCLKFLKKKPKQLFCIGVSPGDAYHMYPLYSGLGGYVFGGTSGNYNVKDLGVDNKKFLKNAPLIDKWYKEKLINQNVTGDTALAAFTKKQIPFIITGPWNLDKLRLANINYEISSFPQIIKGIKSVPFYGVQGAMMTKWVNPDKHNVKLLTQQVLADLATKDTQLLVANATIRTPANTLARKAFKDADSAAFFAAGKGAVTMPQILEMGLFWSNVANAWNYKKTDPTAVSRFKKAAAAIRSKLPK